MSIFDRRIKKRRKNVSLPTSKTVSTSDGSAEVSVENEIVENEDGTTSVVTTTTFRPIQGSQHSTAASPSAHDRGPLPYRG
jgi:hypothetical protein